MRAHMVLPLKYRCNILAVALALVAGRKRGVPGCKRDVFGRRNRFPAVAQTVGFGLRGPKMLFFKGD